ncbi:CPBP family intramembrane glutamic endopeptidase [Leptolyngbya sp. 7M]|uniref:CPBP family intramembrane glutamic endopeptidase n=1 Tax=Leptolyngbya sp. 7M TaxID=2812896 RepID=UPI001B8D5D40|nr:CPBP family intramembrane glutamic endopeptidase [Leptolyngbya sp. 7M]QYO67255.1 CPBP family intramembrane metalloprotease [Leptolyngbya sp. 7M]
MSFAAAAEELVFRGYIFQTLIRSNHTVVAFLLTSTLFAMVHQGNPGANIIGWANTFLAGIWFGIAYLKTKELWFVSGIHFAWNWLQGSLYGIEVSGLTDISPHPVFKEIETGPAWIGGGSYGLEGGIVTTISILISIIAIRYLTWERFDKTKRAAESS